MVTSSMSKTCQFRVQTHSSHTLTAQVWVEEPVVEPVMDKTRGRPVALRLLPEGFHAERVKLSRLLMTSPPNPKQSPATGLVCITAGMDEAGAKVARPNKDASK